MSSQRASRQPGPEPYQQRVKKRSSRTRLPTPVSGCGGSLGHEGDAGITGALGRIHDPHH